VSSCGLLRSRDARWHAAAEALVEYGTLVEAAGRRGGGVILGICEGVP
jgi:hypothetical protein